jgi:hypothetical protein
VKLKVSTLISASCPGRHDAGVAVGNHGLRRERALERHHHEQGLRRRDHAANGVHGEHAVDRRGRGLSLERRYTLICASARSSRGRSRRSQTSISALASASVMPSS